MNHIRHPQNPREIVERDQLLQDTLRTFQTPYRIGAEYPTVLNPQDVRFSWGLYSEEHRLIAHANLWPRVLRDYTEGTTISVGLIGNVATHKAYWGQGHMSQLLRDLAIKAAQDGIEAIILWSDLTEFYQKQGFLSCGYEFRYQFNISRLKRLLPKTKLQKVFKQISPHKINPTHLYQSRYLTRVTLDRSLEEQKNLLKTVGLSIYAATSPNKEILSFLCLGKGCDLNQVVHEWGAPDPITLMEGILALGLGTQLPEIILLAPCDLDPVWARIMSDYADSVDQYPMAWTRILREAPQIKELLDKAFIWGLDSI